MFTYDIQVNLKDDNIVAEAKNILGKFAKEVSKNSITVQMDYDANLKDFNKAFDKIQEMCPELTVQVRYDFTQKLLEEARKNLQQMQDSADFSKLAEQLEEAYKVYRKLYEDKAPNAEIKEAVKRIAELRETFYSSGKGTSFLDRIPLSVQKGIDELEDLVKYQKIFDNAKPVKIFSAEEIAKQTQLVENLERELDKLGEQGGSSRKTADINQLRKEVESLSALVSEKFVINVDNTSALEKIKEVQNLLNEITSNEYSVKITGTNGVAKAMGEFVQEFKDIVAQLEKALGGEIVSAKSKSNLSAAAKNVEVIKQQSDKLVSNASDIHKNLDAAFTLEDAKTISEKFTVLLEDIKKAKRGLKKISLEIEIGNYDAALNQIKSLVTELNKIEPVKNILINITTDKNDATSSVKYTVQELEEGFKKLQVIANQYANKLKNFDLRGTSEHKEAVNDALKKLIDQYKLYEAAGGSRPITDLVESEKAAKQLTKAYKEQTTEVQKEASEVGDLFSKIKELDNLPPVKLKVEPNLDPQEFADKVTSLLSEVFAKIKISPDGVLSQDQVQTIGQGIGDIVYEMMQADTLMDRITKDRIKNNTIGNEPLIHERGVYFNSKTGAHSNVFISDQEKSFGGDLKRAILKDVTDYVKGYFDSRFHTHPENYASMSMSADIFSFISDYIKNGIKTQIVAARKNVQFFDAESFVNDYKDLIKANFATGSVSSGFRTKLTNSIKAARQEVQNIMDSDIQSLRQVLSDAKINPQAIKKITDVSDLIISSLPLDEQGETWKKTFANSIHNYINSSGDLEKEFNSFVQNVCQGRGGLRNQVVEFIKHIVTEDKDNLIKALGYTNDADSNNADFKATAKVYLFKVKSAFADNIEEIWREYYQQIFGNIITPKGLQKIGITNWDKYTSRMSIEDFKKQYGGQVLNSVQGQGNGLGLNVSPNIDAQAFIDQINQALNGFFISVNVKPVFSTDDLITAINNQLATRASAGTGEGVSSIVSGEIKDVDLLRQEVDKVTEAIAKKTQAFVNEGQIVDQITAKEAADLSQLLKPLSDIATKLGDAKIGDKVDPEKLRQLGEALQGIKFEDTGAGLAKLNTLINNLANNKNDRLVGVVQTLNDIRDALNKNLGKNSLGRALSELAGQTEGLKALVVLMRDYEKALATIEKVSEEAKANQPFTEDEKALHRAYKQEAEYIEQKKKEAEVIKQIEKARLEGQKQEEQYYAQRKKLEEDVNNLWIRLLDERDAKEAEAEAKSKARNEEKLKQLQTLLQTMEASGQTAYNPTAFAELSSTFERLSQNMASMPTREATSAIDALTESAKALKKELNQIADPAKVEALRTRIDTFITLSKKLSADSKSTGNNILANLVPGKTTKGELSALTAEFGALYNKAKMAGELGLTFGDKWKRSLSNLARYLTTFASFYRVVGYIRQSLTTIKELDDALIDLKKTTSMTNEELEKFYYNSSNIAKETGVTTKEIIDQAAAWSRLGYSSKEASEQMAALSSQFAQISPGMSVETATDGLVSTMKANMKCLYVQ